MPTDYPFNSQSDLIADKREKLEYEGASIEPIVRSSNMHEKQRAELTRAGEQIASLEKRYEQNDEEAGRRRAYLKKLELECETIEKSVHKASIGATDEHVIKEKMKMLERIDSLRKKHMAALDHIHDDNSTIGRQIKDIGLR